MMPTSIGHLSLLTAALLSCGCAGSRPAPPPPEPHPGRYAASPHQLGITEWLGVFAGTGEVYMAASDQWLEVQSVVLTITQETPERITIAGAVIGADAWSLEVDVAASPPGVLNGRYQDRAADSWLTYSLALHGSRITGVIERYAVDASEARDVSPDEWVIDVLRQPGAQP
jgi:hypothetical protein